MKNPAISLSLLASLCLLLSISAVAQADTMTSGTINFTLTTCYQLTPGYCNNPSAATGSFVYDNTSNKFTSFTVAWDSLSFDFTSVANSFADASASGCASLPAGNAFIEDLVCAPSTTGFPSSNGVPVSWGGYTNVDGVSSFTFFFATGSQSYVEYFTGGVSDEIDYGSYTVNLMSCPVNVTLSPGGGFPESGWLPTYMEATLVAADNSTLQACASAYSFAGFDWVQTVTQDLTGNAFAESAPTVPLSAPYPDPPAGGYTYQFPSNFPVGSPGYIGALLWAKFQPNFADAYPFYYSPLDIATGCAAVDVPSASCLLHISDAYSLNFVDASHDPNCSPPAACLGFKTQLVGICASLSPYCTISGPSAPLFQWTWYTNFNGSVGGIYSEGPANLFLPDPGSGTGGITITSINGTQLPPVVPPSQIATTASGLAYSRVTQTFNGTVTIKNLSGSAISGPLQIVFFGMPVNVTLVNATRNLSGTPYLTVPALASLAPGESVTVSVKFKNPSNAKINFTPVIYSGSIN